MYILPAGQPNTFDVFLSTGWDNWCQVRVNDDGTITPIKGIRLAAHFLTHVRNVIGNIFYSDLRSKRKR